jgi:signal transduction histidine kinase/CheY-like chemotaxis protein
LARKRIAVMLATRTVALMGVGFGILAGVATLSLLETGLQELRQRHVPVVADIARRLTPTNGALTAREVQRAVNVFRSTQPTVAAVVTWRDACAPECLTVAADPGNRARVADWTKEVLGKDRFGNALVTARFAGRLHLLVPSAIRDADGLPEGSVFLAVNADSLAAQAFRMALLLVAIAYLLLGSVWWLTKRFVGLYLGERVKHLALQLEAGDRAAPVISSQSEDELGLLDTSIREHVERSVERVREADRNAADTRAMATRIKSTATLAAGVAHDFNNLMMGIMANSEVLKLHLKDQERSQVVLQRIVDCADRGGKLAQQMLAFSRGGKYNPTLMSLNDAITATVHVMEATVPSGVNVHTDLADELPPVLADITQMNQVIGNLYQNALDAVGRHGTIRVHSEFRGLEDQEPLNGGEPPSVIVTVSDSGPGIDTETKSRIFEPFFTTKKRGSGMGLSAAHGIITNHGGSISVEDAPGGGTVFTVRLPTAPEDTFVAPRPAVRVPSNARRVLLVDDEVAILEPTAEILAAEGYSVVTAENGVEAIRVAREYGEAIDIIILDLRMPVLGGTDAFDSLVTACPRAKVIVSSGYEMDAEARHLLEQGAAAFLNKPFTSEKLITTIVQAVGRDKGR